VSKADEEVIRKKDKPPNNKVTVSAKVSGEFILRILSEHIFNLNYA